MSIVNIKGLSKEIKGVQVLHRISAEFNSGKIYGLFGRNGSGKTMLLRAIAGLIKPTEGTVEIDGLTLHRDVSFPPSIGVIIESPGFWDEYTGFKNLEMLASIKGIIGREEIEASIQAVDLDPSDRRPVKNYSLGMKQRLAIAQAIMEKPMIILLDEPTNALDEDSVSTVRTLLLEQKKRGAIVILASHNKEDLIQLSDETYKMENGQLKFAEL